MQQTLFRNIVFGTDFSENSDEAFAVAKDLAWRYGATLHIVHVIVTFSFSPVREVYVPVEYDAKLVEQATEAARASIEDRYVAKLKEKQPYAAHILSGYPSTEIIQFAKDHNADLIVMGSHGLTGLAHVIFGSTADRVVRRAPCSVLAVRAFRAEGQERA